MERKKVAIIGATGGIGREICFKLAKLNYDMVLLNKNISKSEALKTEILKEYSLIKIDVVTVDLTSMDSVKKATEELKQYHVDILILNAGIFNVPLQKLDSGYNNVFQVNFVSQYYIARKMMENGVGKIIAMGSIAYKSAKIYKRDIDYSNCKRATKVYGNSKRFLMLSLFELAKQSDKCHICIVHPGITLTSLTGHYPKWINWLIKISMKLLFHSPKKASESVIMALNKECGYLEWIGPRLFDIWGTPKKKKIKHVSDDEIKKIAKIANNIYRDGD